MPLDHNVLVEGDNVHVGASCGPFPPESESPVQLPPAEKHDPARLCSACGGIIAADVDASAAAACSCGNDDSVHEEAADAVNVDVSVAPNCAAGQAEPAGSQGEDDALSSCARFEELANEVLAEGIDDAYFSRRQFITRAAEERCEAWLSTNSFASFRNSDPVGNDLQIDTRFFRGSLFDIPGLCQD